MLFRPTVCLCMIVKDEAHVIERCLNSLKPHIDHWIIVDTGSSDSTPEMIQNTLQSLPGALHHRPWVNFEHNRNEALALAEGLCDYSYIIDADEEFLVEPSFEWPSDGADGYEVLHGTVGTEHCYHRTQLIRSESSWRYEGVLHEVLIHHAPHTDIKILNGVKVLGHFDSARNQGDQAEKYARDAEVLEAALKEDPDNARHQFYLAQSYRDSRQWEKSIAAYERRVSMGGWDEEVWYSMFQVGCLYRQMVQYPQAIARLLDAYEFRPSRAESLYELAFIHRLQSHYRPGLMFAREGQSIPLTSDRLFVDHSVYHWRLRDEYAIAASWVGQYELAYHTNVALLESGKLPNDQFQRVCANRDWCVEKMGQQPF